MEKKKITVSNATILGVAGVKKKAKATPYSNLQKAKKGLCKGTKTVEQVQKAAEIYIKSAVSKGKTEKQALETAKRVTMAGCRTSNPKKGIKTAISSSKSRRK